MSSPRANLWCLSIVWIVLILLLGAASVQPNPNLATAGTGFGKIEFERLDRYYSPTTTAPLPSAKSFYAAIPFTKFDRKQNTRLWPFIFTGITRSPPVEKFLKL